MKSLDLTRIDLGPNAEEVRKVLEAEPTSSEGGEEIELVPPHKMRAPLAVDPSVETTTPGPESLFCRLEKESGLSGLRFSPTLMIERAARKDVGGVLGNISQTAIKKYQGGPIGPMETATRFIDSVDDDDGPKPFVMK